MKMTVTLSLSLYWFCGPPLVNEVLLFFYFNKWVIHKEISIAMAW